MPKTTDVNSTSSDNSLMGALSPSEKADCPRVHSTRQLLRDLEAYLFRLLRHRSSDDYDPLISCTCNSVPFDSVPTPLKHSVVSTVLEKLRHRSVN
jgi:hypothetical protein